MPSKKKKYNARFPPARIKKIMQSDEEVGKVAQVVPIIISKSLEIFVKQLLTLSCEVTRSRNARTLTPTHIKSSILNKPEFSFLNDLAQAIPDVQNTIEEEQSHQNFNEDNNPTLTPLNLNSSPSTSSGRGHRKSTPPSTDVNALANRNVLKVGRGRPRKRALPELTVKKTKIITNGNIIHSNKRKTMNTKNDTEDDSEESEDMTTDDYDETAEEDEDEEQESVNNQTNEPVSNIQTVDEGDQAGQVLPPKKRASYPDSTQTSHSMSLFELNQAFLQPSALSKPTSEDDDYDQ